MGPVPVGLRRRLAWFAGLYVASLGAFAALVYGLKALVGH
jgi:hypothetical protein